MEFNLTEQYKSVLNGIKKITSADDCSIFLFDDILKMDSDEKKEIFDDRIEELREASKEKVEHHDIYEKLNNLNRDDINKYSILSFFVGTGEYWELDNYKKRPHKYIIIKDDELSGKQIPKEGLTAFCARTKKDLVRWKRQAITKNAAFEGINERDIKVHPKCKQVAMRQIIDSKDNVIGVIRCDKYDIEESHDTDFSRKTISKLNQINDIIVELLSIGEEKEGIYSYDRLYAGINLLECLKDIGDLVIVEGEDEEIYKYTKKLFYVLKRRRYFGYEDIINRVFNYIKDTCSALNLKDEPIINVLENFKKHEDLMLYSNEQYRDHLMHQFHVFVLGYVILHLIGINNVTNILNKRMSEEKGIELTNKNTLRIWFLAALFHDSSYLLSNFDENISEFLTDMISDSSDNFQFKVDLKWDQLFDSEAKFLQHLNSIIEFFDIGIYGGSISSFSGDFSGLILNKNHGVLSSLIMSKKMKNANIDTTNTFEVEKNIAALSIALHTKEAYQMVAESYALNQNQNKIIFEEHPIVFLLAFADFVQEWGRKSLEKNLNEWGSPMFHSINGIQNEITCNLLYNPHRFCRADLKIPTKEQLKNWYTSLKSSFSSIHYGFAVNYFQTQEENDTDLDISSAYRLDGFNLKSSSVRKTIRYRSNGTISSNQEHKIFIVDFSFDNPNRNASIGFTSDNQIPIDSEIILNINIGANDLSGMYSIKRNSKNNTNYPYKYFMGAERINSPNQNGESFSPPSQGKRDQATISI